MIRATAYAGLALLVVCAAGCTGNPKNPKNELPTGFLDLPANGAVLQPGPTHVGGWAVDDTGVAEVRIYFDLKYAGSTTLSVARPDVSKAMPTHARGTDIHGWNAYIDFGREPGGHTILAQAVDSHGATRDLGMVTVTIPK